MTDTSDPPVQHDEGDMLTTAYMAGYHKRDDEVRALKAENERMREALRAAIAAAIRQRGEADET